MQPRPNRTSELLVLHSQTLHPGVWIARVSSLDTDFPSAPLHLSLLRATSMAPLVQGKSPKMFPQCCRPLYIAPIQPRAQLQTVDKTFNKKKETRELLLDPLKGKLLSCHLGCERNGDPSCPLQPLLRHKSPDPQACLCKSHQSHSGASLHCRGGALGTTAHDHVLWATRDGEARSPQTMPLPLERDTRSEVM